MGFSFSGEFTASTYTAVENAFIAQYLPISSGITVKVYLYGLYLCSKADTEMEISDLCEALGLTPTEVMDAFNYWEEFGLLQVTSLSPVNIVYYPVKAGSKPRKFKAEKYAEFTKSAQNLITSRMISTGEFTEYFNLMETYKLPPEAMLYILKYCVDKKGNDINYRYVSKVAKDFGEKGLNTVEKIEKELSSYVLKTSVIEKILSALSLKRQPEIDDLNLFKKWTKELNFEPENIIYAAKQLKRGSINKLDEFIMELYSLKCFSKEEIKTFFEKKKEVVDLTIKINRALSIYVEILDTEIDNYVNKWVSYGFLEDALLYVATHCFKVGKNTLADMDELIEYLRKRGLIDLSSVGDYFAEQEKADEFIKKILNLAGINRRPTPWDRENLNTWKSWNFSDEMILEACRLASGKSSPIAYVNRVLSNWKNNDIYTLEGVTAPTSGGENTVEQYNLEYKNRRAVAMARAQKNVDKAMTLDDFPVNYERFFSIEKDLAFAEISGDKDKLNALENEQKLVQNNLTEILATIGLEIADLSPKYACEKCNDTGYVGTHRCDCFNKK